MERVRWYNGSVRDADSFPVRPSASLWRGEGYFETLAVFDDTICNPDDHLQRLRESAPDAVAGRLEELRNDFPELIDRFSRSRGLMKIVVWDGKNTPSVAAWIEPYDPPGRDQYEEGIGLDIERRSHPPRWPLTNEKRTSYASVMARRRAADGWGVLYTNLDGRVWECGIANIVWNDDGTLRTPTGDGRLLPGTVVSAICNRREQWEGTMVEESFHVEEPDGGLWVANSLIGLLPVRQLGERILDVTPESPVRDLLRPTPGSDMVIPFWYDD